MKLLAAAGVLLVVAAAVYLVAFWLVQPPRPGKFYDTPEDLPEAGTLIRSETVDSDVEDADAHRILHASKDRDDPPIAVSGLVLVPRQAPPDAGFPVVAWAHGTSGVARRCAPSLTPERTTDVIMGVQELLDRGYVVVASDYQGLGTGGPHPYLVGKSEAQAVLDSIRAVQGDDAWQAGSSTVLWGHSQGGHAALFASQHAPAYAPELELLGTAVAAPATDLGTLLEHDITTPVGKVFGSMALRSWSELFEEAELARIVKGRDLPMVETIASGCIEVTEQGLVLLPEVALMSRDFVASNPAKTEPWATIIRDNTVRPEGIDLPLFLAQGSDDAVIQPDVSRSWVKGMCQQNPSVRYREYPGKDHLSVTTAATREVLRWTEERFAGKPAPGNCSDL